MSAPSKRRHFRQYISLPIVVAIVCFLIVQLVAMQRADFIAKLSDRIAHSDTRDAIAAVREMAEMAHPPAEGLVVAAAGADREVAAQARQSITKWLGRAERQIELNRSPRAVAQQLVELAASLDAHRTEIAGGDAGWLVDTTQRVLTLANELPKRHAPLVAFHCDSVLSHFSDTQQQLEEAIHSTSARQLAPATTGDAAQSRLSATDVIENAEEPMKDPAGADNSLDSAWRQEWSRPVFRTPPRQLAPIHPEENQNRTPPTLPRNTVPPEIDVQKRPLAGVDTRALLRDWLSATGAERAAFEQELQTRGFTRLPESCVQKLCSPEQEQRLQLIDEVLTAPGVDVRPWLLLLADDPEADIRLAAVTTMATSNDATLLEKAWQTAIHDRDPRIAALAGRLRERRASSQQRWRQ